MTDNFLKYDADNLLEVTARLPEESETALNNSLTFSENYEDISNITICGMGGSCISGDLLKSYLYNRSDIPVVVNRSSELPNFVNEKTLSVFISYSGNTYETVNCYKQAISKNSKCLVITSGGEIEKIAKENNHKIIKITGKPKMPRAAVGELFYSLIGVLSAVKDLNIDINEVKNSFDTLKEIKSVQKSDNSSMLALAKKSQNKNIAVFGISPTTEAIALRWKNQLNENAKTTVLFNSFPELTHNEIVNLSKEDLEKYFIIVLRDKSENSFIKKQIDTSLELLSGAIIENLSVDKENLFERQIALIYLGDYFSIYHALINGIDPTPIEAIMSLKEKMKE